MRNTAQFTYQRYLDGLRCVAISWVFLLHANSAASFSNHGVMGLFLTRGGMGVDLFFVISGFLITSILLKEHDQTGRISLARFYTRRILRLWPAYITLISVTMIYAIFLMATHRDPVESSFILRTIKWPALYLTNIYASYSQKHCTLLHTWSLCLEEQFYLIWSVILVFSGRRAKWVALGGIFAIGAWRSWLILHLPPGAIAFSRTYDAPDTRMDVLFFGCVIAFLLADQDIVQKLKAALDNILVPAVLAVFLVGSMYISNPWSGYIGGSIGYSASALTMTLILVYLHVVRPKWAMIVLESRPAVFIGRISYGMYLFQRPVIDGVMDITGKTGYVDKIEFLVLAYAANVLVAAVSYKLIESPFLRLKTRFSSMGVPQVSVAS